MAHFAAIFVANNSPNVNATFATEHDASLDFDALVGFGDKEFASLSRNDAAESIVLDRTSGLAGVSASLPDAP